MSGADDLLRRARELLAAMPEDGRPDVDRIREAVVLAGEQLKAEDYWAEHEHEAAAGLLAPDTDPPADASSGRMRFLDLDELRAQAAAQGRRFLIDELWPDGDYGVLGAEDKAGKTWAIDDLGVSIVTGTPWLGRYEVAEGSVLLLHGEGGARNLLRRLDAICRGRDLELDEVIAARALRVALAVPRLDSPDDVGAVSRELEAHPARAVLLDPLYLAAGGGKGRDLYAMGEALERIQSTCQASGSALVTNAQWNKTGEGTGAQRFTGVGPGAWGRVLGSAAVEQRHTDGDGRSTVTLLWEFTGGEIPDTRFRMRRRVWVDDPHDLGSAMHYGVEVTEEGIEAIPADLTATQDRVLAPMRGGGRPGEAQLHPPRLRDAEVEGLSPLGAVGRSARGRARPALPGLRLPGR
jgi:hypothetical protein